MKMNIVNEVVGKLNYLMSDAESGVLPNRVTDKDIRGVMRADPNLSIVDEWSIETRDNNKRFLIVEYILGDDAVICKTVPFKEIPDSLMINVIPFMCPFLRADKDVRIPSSGITDDYFIVRCHDLELKFDRQKNDDIAAKEICADGNAICSDVSIVSILRSISMSSPSVINIYHGAGFLFSVTDNDRYALSFQFGDKKTPAIYKITRDGKLSIDNYGLSYIGDLTNVNDNKCIYYDSFNDQPNKDFTKGFVGCPIMLTSIGIIPASEMFLPARVTIGDGEKRTIYNMLYDVSSMYIGYR